MDSAAAVSPSMVTLEQSLDELFKKCLPDDPELSKFIKVIDAVEMIHQVVEVPFSRREYWNDSIIEGSAPVYPPEVTSQFSIPEALDEVELARLESIFSQVERIDRQLIVDIDSLTSESRRRANNGRFDQRALDRNVANTVVHVEISAEDDDEDDFL